MYLNASTDKIEIVLGGTVATNQLQWNVSYQDITSSGMTLPQSGGAGLTNNATAVDIVAAPAASTTRQVTQINVYNADTATATVTIQKDVSGTNYVLIRYALTTLDTLMWSREDGWRVMSATGGGTTYTFSTGLTNTSGTVTANLSTGVAGGQSVIGGTAASNSLTLSSTSNATKGKILFGTSAYDEVNNRLGIGTASPGFPVEIADNSNTFFVGLRTINSNVGTTASNTIRLGNDNAAFEFTIYSSGYTNVANTDFPSSTRFRSSANATNGYYIGTGSNNANAGITFFTADTFKARIFNNGNFLIQNGGAYSDAGFRLDVNGTARVQGRVTVNQDTTVTTQTVSVITSGTTNAGLVLQPNGTGAIMAQAPNATTTGGNARGTNAVDFQFSRTNANQVASGSNSAILCGINNQNVGGNNAVVAGNGNVATFNSSNSIISGFQNTTDGTANTTFGRGNTNNGTHTFASGFLNTINSATENSIIFGRYGLSYTESSLTIGASNFPSVFIPGAAQSCIYNSQIEITGTSQTELLIKGSNRAILNLSSPGPTNARAWRAQVDLVAIASTVGNGTVTLNDCFMGSYHVGIKRVGTTTSLVGAVSVTNEVSDTSMSTSVVTIDADDTNEALRIRLTPPTTAGSTTVIRVVATAYITEVGR